MSKLTITQHAAQAPIRKARRATDLAESFVRLCKLHGIREPVREHRFAAEIGMKYLKQDRDFRFDAAWFQQRLAVEIHGGVWTGGAHNRGSHFTSDCEKLRYATLLGWRVLTFTGTELREHQAMVVAVVKAALLSLPAYASDCCEAYAKMNEASKSERERLARRAAEKKRRPPKQTPISGSAAISTRRHHQ